MRHSRRIWAGYNPCVPPLTSSIVAEHTTRRDRDKGHSLSTQVPRGGQHIPSSPLGSVPAGRARPRGARSSGGPEQRWQVPGMVQEAMRRAGLEGEQRELVRKLEAEYGKLQKREKLLDTVVTERTKEVEPAFPRLKAANPQALLGLAE